MGDPILWGDAASQVIWTYYLANFVYNTGTAVMVLGFLVAVILVILCLINYLCKKADEVKKNV